MEFKVKLESRLSLGRLLLLMAALSGNFATAEDGIAFFENRIRPLFVERCYSCHSAEAKKVRGALKLDTREDFLKGGTDGKIVVPGKPDESRLIRAVRYEDPDLQMPPNKDGGVKLSDRQIADLVQWIGLGAPFPETEASRKLAAKPWSFEPIKKSPIPATINSSWPATSVDWFILANIEKQGLRPAPLADKLTLIRRATFDLTGLPPTPAEIAAFEGDQSTNAFGKVVDRLLSSPAYGERWGRHWLDVVRYADTAGDTADYPVGLAWRYRNYVIDAFNSDKPYDVFLREQIAGDILASRGPRERFAEGVIATGYLAISRRFGFDSENYHHLTIQDTLDSLGQTALGLSLGCARCHDHKFDPISMHDYYALYGIFASSRYAFAGSEQKGKLRAMVPLIPPDQSQPKWRDFDQRVAALSDFIGRQKLPVPSALVKSLHDPDGDFEIQKDAAGGSYGVLVPPWEWKGKVSVTAAAQSPFKNLYPMGKFGASVAHGETNYLIYQALHPRRTRENSLLLHFNLDFRLAAPDAAAPGRHQFWIGARSSPAVVLSISSEAVFLPSGEKLAGLKAHEWHNVQLTLDLKKRVFAGRIGRPGDITSFENIPVSPLWTGRIEHVQFDSNARSGAVLPGLEIDNFGVQVETIGPVSTAMPQLPQAPGQPDADALNMELQKLVGLDSDLEAQRDGETPVKPWNPGPNSVVKVSAAAQSPFVNLVPPGRLGLHMPNRSDYDGFGLTLPDPYTAARLEELSVAFDFRCGEQGAGGDGSWRYYIGHGGGGSTAVELEFNASDFFVSSGTSHVAIAKLRPGEWHQIQLTLNLKKKSFVGNLATFGGSVPSVTFQGAFATNWDGTIDYTFIDGRGHRPGARPALDADNFVFRETAFPPLTASAVAGVDSESAARLTRILELRAHLAKLSADASRLSKDLLELLTDGPCEAAYGVVEGSPHDSRLQYRGEPDRPGDVVPRGFLTALGGRPLPPETEGSGRLELAQWLTSPGNPLTSRVMANRIWQYHFGRGLVTTPNDFGLRGQLPTHPELLDHLAARFVESGWSIKAMHRLIMLSATYRQVSGHAFDSYASFQRRRLMAEEIRDSILAVSGELDKTPGRAHPFPSPVTSSFSQHNPFIAAYDNNRRSVYLMTQRLKRHPFLALFDGPDPNASTAERRLTTVPTQALYFLNSPFVHEKAEKFAERLRSKSLHESQQIETAMLTAFGRAPTDAERTEAAEFLESYRRELLAQNVPNVETTALAAYVRSLFGGNEFLHID